MKVQLLHSTFDNNDRASRGQHFTCFVINDVLALDAGSLATSISDAQRESIRDIVLTHAHLDHIAGLPLFIDDLFATLTEPVRVHAAREVIDILERDIFNWSIYPRFSELRNSNGPVLDYRPFETGRQFTAAGLSITPASVNHKVPSSGFLIDDGKTKIAMSGDTAEMSEFWEMASAVKGLDALLIECAFPNELSDLADISYHLTPDRMFAELSMYSLDCPVYVINMKPMYRAAITEQIGRLAKTNVSILEVGKSYEF